jgi:hypothetical protein
MSRSRKRKHGRRYQRKGLGSVATSSGRSQHRLMAYRAATKGQCGIARMHLESARGGSPTDRRLYYQAADAVADRCGGLQGPRRRRK